MNRKTTKHKKNKKKYQNNKNYAIICSVLLFVTLGLLLYRVVTPFYKVDSRVEKVKKADKNEEVVIGWIKVQGTNIDYPVVYQNRSKDIGTNLAYDYAWTRVNSDKLTNRKVIFGHNILNLSSHPQITNKNHDGFEQLLSFIYPEFLKNNKYIQFTIDGKDYLYKIFSVSFVDTIKGKLLNTKLSKKEFAEYIKETQKESYFDFDVDVDENDGIITLATCTRFFGSSRDSFRIDARLVRNGEIISNYDFKQKKNYNEVKKILKGDETNEKA